MDADTLAYFPPGPQLRGHYHGSTAANRHREIARLDDRGTGQCGPWPWTSPEPGCNSRRLSRCCSR